MPEKHKNSEEQKNSISLYKKCMRNARESLEHARFPEYVHEFRIGFEHLGNAVLELHAEYIARLNQLTQRLTRAAESLESRNAYGSAAQYREMCGDVFLNARIFIKDDVVSKAIENYTKAVLDYKKEGSLPISGRMHKRRFPHYFQHKITSIEEKINSISQKHYSD